MRERERERVSEVSLGYWAATGSYTSLIDVFKSMREYPQQEIERFHLERSVKEEITYIKIDKIGVAAFYYRVKELETIYFKNKRFY